MKPTHFYIDHSGVIRAGDFSNIGDDPRTKLTTSISQLNAYDKALQSCKDASLVVEDQERAIDIICKQSGPLKYDHVYFDVPLPEMERVEQAWFPFRDEWVDKCWAEVSEGYFSTDFKWRIIWRFKAEGEKIKEKKYVGTCPDCPITDCTCTPEIRKQNGYGEPEKESQQDLISDIHNMLEHGHEYEHILKQFKITRR